MYHFMVKAMMIVVLAVEGGRRRDANHVVLGRILRGKSRVVDHTGARISTMAAAFSHDCVVP